jgi:hypothetical protein
MSQARIIAASLLALQLATAAVAAPQAADGLAGGTGPAPSFEPLKRSLDAETLLFEGQAIDIDRDALFEIPVHGRRTFRNVPVSAVRAVDLELERIPSPLADATCVVVDRFGRTLPLPRPDVSLFAGSVAGKPGSQAFLAFSEGMTQGFVEFEGEKFMLASGSPEDPHPPAFFDTKSAAWQEIEWRPWSCNAIPVPGFEEEIPAEGDASLMPTCRVIQLALDTDTQYLGRFGGNTTNAANYAAILVAATNSIFQAQASASFQVTYLRLWSTPDPWTVAGGEAALYQFRDYWNANMGSITRDTAHLLLGSSLSDAGGIAFQPALCDSYSYGISAGITGSFPTPVTSRIAGNWDLVVFAHELGHNCNAWHTFELSPPYDNCPSNCSNASTIGTIMSYCHGCPGGVSNIALTFAPPNVSQLNSYIWSRPCVHTQECQSDPNCVLAATPTASLVPVAGQTVSVSVSGLHAACSFAPTGLPSWITLGAGATSGTSGTLNFIVAANPATADRTATIAIGARTHVLTQMGSDRDGDGIPNGSDNCVLVANPGQHDGDGDGVGNECDNCPLLANASQADANADGVGDACATPSGYSQTVNLGSVTVGGGCSPALTSPLAAAPGARIVAFTLQFGFTGNGNFSYASDVALGILGKQWGGYDCVLPGHEWVRFWNSIPASGQSGTYAETVTGLNLPMGSAGAIQFANGWGNSPPVAYANVTVTLQIQGAEPDSDGDGLPDQLDNCPGVASTDRSDFDGDGRGDACDECPTDPAKFDPGSCGCGQSDGDGDGDGVPDCEDNFCDTPTWLAGPFGDGTVHGLPYGCLGHAGRLFVCGYLTSPGGGWANGIVAWNPAGNGGLGAWESVGGGLTGGSPLNGGLEMVELGGDLYVTGAFTHAGGLPAANIARWDSSANVGVGAWKALGSGLNGSGSSLAVLDGVLYVGGSFTSAGGISASNIARWDPAANSGQGAWSAVGSGVNSTVQALAVHGGRIYAGGSFTTAGGAAASRVACWTPGTGTSGSWSSLGTGCDGSVDALASLGGSLYVGGYFSQAGSLSATRLARWTPAATGSDGAWSALTEHYQQGVGGTAAEVRALRAFDGRLYIGGRFASAGGVYSKDVVMWDDLNRFTAMGGGTHDSSLFKVRDFTEFQGRIYAVGDFSGMRNAGQQAIDSYNIAEWGCPDQPAARPWTPGELAGVQAWFSPDTLPFHEGSGRAVSAWPSTVGSVTVTAPDAMWATQWPITSIDASGRKSLVFDGDAGLAAGPTDLLRNVGGASAFAVRSFDQIPVAIESLLHLSNGTSLSSPRLILRASATGRSESGVRRTDSAVTAIARASTGVSTDFQIQGVIADFGQGSVRQFVNGAAAGQTSISTGTSSNTPSLGLALGRTVNGTQHFAGRLSEAIIVGRALSVDERARVEGYLAHRYSLADALPASHAYRDEPPTVESDCSFSLAATSQTIPWTDGGSSLAVLANAYTCGWTVATDADWITLDFVGTMGSGSRTVSFTVSTNLGDAPRVGTISIAGLVHTVTQEASCLGSFASVGSHVEATAGEGSVWFSTSGTSCAWSVTSDAPWLTLLETPSVPAGAAEVRFAFAGNDTGGTRSALLTAMIDGAAVAHRVTQAAPCPGAFGFESSVGHPGIQGGWKRIDVLEAIGGDLYAGGSFSTIDGVAASGIARRDGTTGEWRALGSGLRDSTNSVPPTSVRQIVALGNRIYVRGVFARAGDLSAPVPGFAAWDTQLEAWVAVGAGSPFSSFGDMVAHAGCLYVMGTVTGSNQSAFARYQPDRGEWSIVPGLSGPSNHSSMASVRGRLHVSGAFPVQVDGFSTTRWQVLSLDPQTSAWSVVFDEGDTGSAYIDSLFEFEGQLYATGGFQVSAETDPHPVVRFPAGTGAWVPVGEESPWLGWLGDAGRGFSWMGKLCVPGWHFEPSGEFERSFLALFDPVTGTWDSTDLGYDYSEYSFSGLPALAPFGDRLWIGGGWMELNGVPVRGLATYRCGPDEYGPCVFGADFPDSIDIPPGGPHSGEIDVDMANPWCEWTVAVYTDEYSDDFLSVEGGGPGDGSIRWSTRFIGCAESVYSEILVTIRRAPSPSTPYGDLERFIDASESEVYCESLAFTTKSTTVGSEGGEGQATLGMSCDGCAWAVTSDSEWIEIIDGEDFGDDSAGGMPVERIILFEVAANEGYERTATLTSHDGRTLVVTQESGLVPWTPAVLSGVGAWFRADAIPEADRAGGLVSRWIDSTGGFDLTASGSARPQYVASGLSGKPTVRFDGTDDALTRGSTSLLNGKPGATVYAVRSFAEVPSSIRTALFLSTGSSGNTARLALRGSASGKPETAVRRADGGTTVLATGPSNAATAAQLHGAVADFAGNLVTQFVDGVPAGTAAPTAGSTSATNAVSFAIGRAGTGSNFHAGDITEAIVIERALSAADRQRLEGYLAHRWGLAANLPTNHPYRTAPPVYVEPCTVASLAYDAANEGPAAGTGEVWVSTNTPACGWSATSSESWLSIDAPVGGEGVGSGWLAYSFAANATGSVRTATISIAVEGRVSTLTVAQQPSCPSGLGWEVGFANPGLRESAPYGGVGSVRAMQSLGGSLYVAGGFTQAGGQPAGYVARWNPATSTWSPLGSGLNSVAHAFATIGGQLYVGGSFTAAGGGAANGVARWDPVTSTWSALGAGLTGPSATVLALAEVDGQLFAAGRFVQAGSTLVSNVARWDPSSNSWLPLGSVGAGVDGTVYDAVGCRGKLYVSGEFRHAGGLETQGIACWDPATGQWSSLPELGEGTYCTVLASIRGTIYAGASLATSEFEPAEARVLRWDPTAGAWVSTGYSGAVEPFAIAEFGGGLFVAGTEFLGLDYQLPSLRRQDPATGAWSDNLMAELNQPAWEGLQIYQLALSLAVVDGGLFVGGDFTGVLGVHAGAIARLRCGPDEYQQCVSLGLSSTSVSVPNGGSRTGSVTVDLATPWCRWEVQGDENAWISMTESGTGDGTIDWATGFDGCAGANSHSVMVSLRDPYGGIVDWEQIDFTQASVPCGSSSFVSTGSPLPAAGGVGSASLVMSCDRCDWSVTSDSAWLTVTDGEGSGSGNGSGPVRTILFTAAANSGLARTATLTAQDGRTLAITQEGSSSPWSPSDLPAVQAWFKADAIPEVDRVGNLVSRWVDSASSGLFPVTATSTARPAFVANAIEGKPVVRFDGVNDGLNRGASALVNNANGGMMIAVRRHSAVPTTTRTVAFLATGSSTANPRLTLRSSATGLPQSVARRLDANANVTVNAATAVPTTFQLHAIDANFVQGTLAQWVNGTAAGTATMTTGLTSNTNAAGFGIGRGASAANYFAGDIAEVIVVRGAVSTADRQRLEGYLAHRWGLAAGLPASHPYRNSPPTSGGGCTFTLSSTTASVPATAGSGSFTVTASGASCGWAASSGASWLTVSPASGTGTGTVTYSFQANADTASRTGTVTAGGQTFTVTQAGVPCTFTLSSTTASVPATAGSGSFTVTASGASCGWTASSGASWLTVSPASGTGTGTVTYSFQANADTASRTGTMTAGGQTFTVTQAGVPCTFTLSSTTASVPATAGSGTFTVTASGTSCAWTATSGAAWLTVSPPSGTGTGTVTFSFQANAGSESRTGTITAGGQSFTVTQEGAPCTFTLSSTTALVPATAGNGSFTVTTNGTSCGWTASSDASWLTVSPPSGTGTGTITFSWTDHVGGTTRGGLITVGGQVFTVNQEAHPAPANDECVAAVEVAVGVSPFDTRGARTGTDNGPGCSSSSSTVNRNDVWFKYTAVGNGEVSASTCGQTSLDTRISVFNACGAATPIVCNDDACGPQSRVAWEATAGTTYWISVGSWFSSGFGTGTLTIDTASAAPANDECANAIAIATGVIPFDNRGAVTSTDNGPTCIEHTSSVNRNDIWFAYTAVASGEATISTCGQTTLDTKISVFLNCGDPAPIVCNDDTCDFQSTVTWTVVAGTRYLISLGSYGATQFGTGTFTLTAPSPPWTPDGLVDLQAWYRADSIEAADRVGDLVSRWVDSRSSFHVTASGTTRPQFIADGQAGKPVVRFDGVDDGLTRGTTNALVSAEGGSIFAVRRFNALGSAARTVAWVARGTGTSSPRLAIRGAELKPESVIRRLDTDVNTVISGPVAASTTAFQIHGVVADWASGAMSQWVDGLAAGTGTTSAGATSPTTSAGLGIGRAASANAYLIGDIAEVVIVKKALSTCERERLEGYLAHRWGLAASLPATHPFRNAAPTTADACGSLVAGGEEPEAGVPAVIAVESGSVSLQPWIDAAADGATLRVPAGTYRGALAIAGKSLVIESEAGASATILDGEGQVGTVVSVTDGASVVLRGFTIRGGLGGTPLELGDGATRLVGGGILVRDAGATLAECLVEGNLAGFGGGVAAVDAEVELVLTELRGNHAALEGGGLWSWASSGRMMGGFVRGNVAGGSGGGIHLDESSSIESFATEFCDNEPDDVDGSLSGDPAGCSACAADLDRDGTVAAGDLATFLSAPDAEGLDLDGDGSVSADDLAILLAAWGTACGG